jgi:hypothetical protein
MVSNNQIIDKLFCQRLLVFVVCSELEIIKYHYLNYLNNQNVFYITIAFFHDVFDL